VVNLNKLNIPHGGVVGARCACQVNNHARGSFDRVLACLK